MKHNFLHLQTLSVVLCIISAMACVSCSDDDPQPQNSLVGEWISDDGDIYYQFLSDGTGRYIFLADELGYNPSYPDAVINHPVDSDYFDYTIVGDTLTMKEYYQNSNSFAFYVYLMDLNTNVLQLRRLRWSDDGINWHNVFDEWEPYNRWEPSK